MKATSGLFVDPTPSVVFFALNTHRRLFRSTAARQAINYAIDRAALARTLGPAGGLPTDQYLPPSMTSFPGSGLRLPTRQTRSRQGPKTHRQGRRSPPGDRDALHVQRHPAVRGARRHPGERSPTAPDSSPDSQLPPRNGIPSRHGTPSRIRHRRRRRHVRNQRSLFSPRPQHLQIHEYGLPHEHDPAYRKQSKPEHRPRPTLAPTPRLARDIAPLAAYAIPNQFDLFSDRVSCEIYQPVYGIDLTRLCPDHGGPQP